MGGRRAAGLALTAALLGSNPVRAEDPAWDYLEYFRLKGQPQFDESGYGDAARLSVPLGEFVYFSAAGDRIDAKYDDSPVSERLTLGSAGLGMHTTGGPGQLFGVVSYVEKRRVQYTPTAGGDHATGAAVTVGAHWLATPYLSVEPQGGLKGYDWDGFLKLTLAVRLLPHVWTVGEFSHNVIHGNEYLVGLRIAWSDYTPSQRPGAAIAATPAGSAREGDLAVGQTLVTLRPLVPQVRPAAGAPELAPIPKDSKIVLQESIKNEFGTWWRVETGDQAAWIRETDLKGRP